MSESDVSGHFRTCLDEHISEETQAFLEFYVWGACKKMSESVSENVRKYRSRTFPDIFGHVGVGRRRTFSDMSEHV